MAGIRSGSPSTSAPLSSLSEEYMVLMRGYYLAPRRYGQMVNAIGT